MADHVIFIGNEIGSSFSPLRKCFSSEVHDNSMKQNITLASTLAFFFKDQCQRKENKTSNMIN